ncbi:hypothetical protein C9374_005661 [Naegleria lovaniensis]|uniref:Uncharacterized protein n=1 Tax=Naegleria lovaniensis TaxID=51637 RepID=A0AA88GJ10_NAELO|nr:uncharacterized protein C9374_005661 [Naegleria lovaniensis]KAG2381869.1 hypothetical protein C9374_005661 [Naegleria lovaniensis]
MPRKQQNKKIPFAKGFTRPNKKEIKQAIASDEIYYDFEMKRPSDGKTLFYKPVPDPTSIDDWLAQYVEDRDSYDEWMDLRKRVCKKNTIRLEKDICLLWIERENTNHPRKQFLVHLKRFIEAFYYGIHVRILDPFMIKKSKKQYYIEFNDVKYNISSRRCHEYDEDKAGENEIQFRAADVLVPIHRLKKTIDTEISCICGVTMEDLYIGKKDSFTCGLAQGGDHIGVFSMCRYNPEFRNEDENSTEEKDISVEWDSDGIVDEEKLSSNDLIIIERCCKIVVHELAHMQQIGHCVFFDCIMNGSGWLEEDYRQSIQLCPVDLRKFQTLMDFDILERYKALLRFYKAYRINDAALWVEDMIQYLTKRQQELQDNDIHEGAHDNSCSAKKTKIK